jgi:hypothetical protein
MSEGGRRWRSREEVDALHHPPPCFYSAVSHDVALYKEGK